MIVEICIQPVMGTRKHEVEIYINSKLAHCTVASNKDLENMQKVLAQITAQLDEYRSQD